MSNIQETNTNNLEEEQNSTAKTNALIAYGMMLVGLFTGVFWIVGAIWAMIKKGEAQDSKYLDHYQNIISTFWWSLGLYIVAFITFFFGIGWFIAMGVAIWSIFRIVKGLARITSNKPFID